MKTTEDCYPQLLAGMYICNAPTHIQVSWRIIIRPLLPVRVVHKFDFIHPLLNQNQEYEQLLLPHLCEDHYTNTIWWII